MAEILTVVLPANGIAQFRKGGASFEVISAVYPITVSFYGEQGSQSDTLSNVLGGLYVNLPYAAFDIRNGAIAQTVQVLCLDEGEQGGNRGSGTVRVIDQNADKSKAATQFVGSVDVVASAALGTFAGIQVDTGKMIAVKRMTVSSSVAGKVSILAGQTAVSGGVTSTPNWFFNKFKGQSKRHTAIFGPLSTDLSGAAEVTGYLPTTNLYLQANLPSELPLTTPVVLSAGDIFGVASLVVNRDMSVYFDFEEI